MKEKEIRAAQLESLKSADSMRGHFVVEILNGAFKPWKTLVFDTMEEAQKKYDELEPVYYGGFLRKYATFGF